MNADDLLLAAIAGALVVVSGGLYSLFLALGRLRRSRRLRMLAVAAFLMLVICSFVLADSLSLAAGWYAVIGVMLIGYWLAPKAIWHLTAATHVAGHGGDR